MRRTSSILAFFWRTSTTYSSCVAWILAILPVFLPSRLAGWLKIGGAVGTTVWVGAAWIWRGACCDGSAIAFRGDVVLPLGGVGNEC